MYITVIYKIVDPQTAREANIATHDFHWILRNVPPAARTPRCATSLLSGARCVDPAPAMLRLARTVAGPVAATG